MRPRASPRRGWRGGGDAAAPPDEIGSRTVHRALRHRRRLAGDAGNRRLHRDRGCRGSDGARHVLRQEVARGRLLPSNPDDPATELRPVRAGDGQDGRGRTELFQRHRPDRVLRRRGDVAAAGIEPQPFFVRITQAWPVCCNSAPATAMCSGSTCGCGPIRPRPRSRSRPPQRCTIMSGKGGPGSAPP